MKYRARPHAPIPREWQNTNPRDFVGYMIPAHEGGNHGEADKQGAESASQ